MDPRKFTRHTAGILPGETTAAQPSDLPQIARIVKADATGAWFELLAAPGHAYGPASWGLAAHASVAASILAGGYPHVGDTALVVFAGAGIGQPVIASWWR